MFLNDLLENDFNNVFGSVHTLTERLKKEKGVKFGPNIGVITAVRSGTNY